MTIRVGVGGWTYEPWRGVFYPDGLVQKRELEYAAQQLTAIEINATYYRLQSAKSFAKWHDAVPDGFVFSVKGSQYVTNRRVLGEAGEAITRFMASGLSELGAKLGPIVWQFAPTKRFDPDDFEAFLRLLPAQHKGLALRHVLDVRHESFRCSEFVALARKHAKAIVYTDSPEFPSIPDRAADFVYARLMNANARFKDGYAPKALGQWASGARAWAKGQVPAGLALVATGGEDLPPPADVYLFFINGAKERAPAAAMALLQRLA